jgi:hypothetical protein
MKDTIIKIISIFVMLMLTSCGHSPQVQAELLPGINIPVENINTFIKLRDTPELANSHKNNDTLDLQVINVSNKTIIFPDNFGLKVFAEDKGNWSEVQNNFYNAGGTFNLPTENLYPGGLFPTVLPYIPGLSSPTTIRVIVVGHVENNDNEQVGAYLDVIINP